MDPLGTRVVGFRGRLPRAGGDGPLAKMTLTLRLLAPPRRRGWTPAASPSSQRATGSPAQAGMDPRRERIGAALRGLPRAGGDGPCPPRTPTATQAAPPRRRGWTPRPRRPGARPAGSPAQAGMDPERRDATHDPHRLPRAGGDGPLPAAAIKARYMAPPRRRGWTRAPRQRRGLARGSPAQAGMDPRRRSMRPGTLRLPRAGGDGPSRSASAIALGPAPPRRRGWTPPDHPRRRAGLGSPAQAGMDPGSSGYDAPGPRLPRAGGDGPATGTGRKPALRAPPRRRGWTRGHPHRGHMGMGSPAQAGMDPRRTRPARPR